MIAKVKIPKDVKVVAGETVDGFTPHFLMIDGEVFPYGTRSITEESVDPNYPHMKARWLTVSFLVDGPVEFAESYHAQA